MSKNSHPVEDPDQLVYSCRLPLSSTTLDLVSGLVRKHLKKIGSRWRKLEPGRIALVVLAVLRHDQRLADMAAAYEISASTVRRWLLEVIGLLAARAERLQRALKRVARTGGVVVLVDGTLIPTRHRSGPAGRPNYSGKRKMHGLHLLALTDERGNLIWVSAARRGRTHDITAARQDHLTAHLREAGLAAFGDLGFLGLDDDSEDPVIITGYRAARGRRLTKAQKEATKLVARERAANEHGFADLKNWRILTKLRLNAKHATTLLRALLVLTRAEISR